MRKLVLEPGLGSVAHDLYDLSLPLPERQEKKMRFESGAAAANFLGIPPNKLFEKRFPGKRITSKRDHKQYAVRVAK